MTVSLLMCYIQICHVLNDRIRDSEISRGFEQCCRQTYVITWPFTHLCTRYPFNINVKICKAGLDMQPPWIHVGSFWVLSRAFCQRGHERLSSINIESYLPIRLLIFRFLLGGYKLENFAWAHGHRSVGKFWGSVGGCWEGCEWLSMVHCMVFRASICEYASRYWRNMKSRWHRSYRQLEDLWHRRSVGWRMETTWIMSRSWIHSWPPLDLP